MAQYKDSAATTAVWEKESALYLRLAKANRMIR